MNKLSVNLVPMIHLSRYINEFPGVFPEQLEEPPWKLIASIQNILTKELQRLSPEYSIHGNVAIHKTAILEERVVLKGPIIISPNCFIAAHSYLRRGVYLGNRVSVGPGCEIKSSFLFSNTALAHFNFAGDSVIGSDVNMEAGADIANHYNERSGKEIFVTVSGVRTPTGMEKFGALVGDRTKIGANAVLSPGTILSRESVVNRLELIEQNSANE